MVFGDCDFLWIFFVCVCAHVCVRGCVHADVCGCVLL